MTGTMVGQTEIMNTVPGSVVHKQTGTTNRLMVSPKERKFGTDNKNLGSKMTDALFLLEWYVFILGNQALEIYNSLSIIPCYLYRAVLK